MQQLRTLMTLAFFVSLVVINSPLRLPGTTIHDELVLKLQPGLTLSSSAYVHGSDSNALNTLLTQAGAGAALPIGMGSNTYRVHLRADADSAVLAPRLAALTGVVFAEPNAIRRVNRAPNDPVVRQQWALRNIQAFEAWDITTGSNLTIAIIDTGVSDSHPDLRGRVLSGYNFYDNNGDASDNEGHGTYTAGVAAAAGDNGIGIAGVCWSCQILPVKVLGSQGEGDDATIAIGIRWAADQGARIISMSLGGDKDTQVLHEAVVYAKGKGALLIAASGNGQSDGNRPAYPAAYPEVLAVSATDGSDTVTGFSTTGDFVDISAPGVGVWSTVWTPRGDSYAAENGTSASCPYVAGAAALVLSIRPDLSADQIIQVLIRSADDRGAPGKDPENGYGRLNLLRAVQLASNPQLSFETPVPVPRSTSLAFAPIASSAIQADARYFSETGHALSGDFRAFWVRYGGLPIFGLPISEEFVERSEDGYEYIVQYFERYRFELHPENQPPYNVLLGRIGSTSLAEIGRDVTSFPKSSAQPGCHFFPETGQNICGAFLKYWQSHGLEFDNHKGIGLAESLALFGLPISQPFSEVMSDGTTVTIQWFERARFEDHGNQGVLLGLLASDLAKRRGWH